MDVVDCNAKMKLFSHCFTVQKERAKLEETEQTLSAKIAGMEQEV